MNETELQALADGIVPVIREYVEKKLGIDAHVLAALQKRVELLEAGAMHFEGPYAPNKAYTPGAVTQRAASLFVALTPSRGETPGSSGSWRKIA